MAHKDDNEELELPEYVLKPGDMHDISATLEVVCKDIGDALEKHYPGWMWAIRPNEAGGIIAIYSLRLSGEWAYCMHIRNAQGHERKKRAVEAGGHILERYGVPRQGYNYEVWKNIPRGLDGELLHDHSDFAKADRDHHRDQALTRAVQDGRVQLKTEDVTDTVTGLTTRHVYVREVNQDGGDE